jgi:hypothetical protein
MNGFITASRTLVNNIAARRQFRVGHTVFTRLRFGKSVHRTVSANTCLTCRRLFT